MRRGRTLPTWLAPWVVLTTSLLLTFAAAAFGLYGARSRDAARFQNAVQAAHDRVLGRLDIYTSTLRGGAALFAATGDVSAADFRRYVERLEIQSRYPGIQGIGFTRRLEHDLAAPADERHSIVYIEPLDERNRAALGFDMYSEPTRREAMRLARDLGEPAMSGPVRLVQEIYENEEQRGFLIYVPVYEGGAVPATVEERRARLIGHVYAPFRADDLFEGIFGSEQFPRVSLAVFDTHEDHAPPAPLHRAPRAPGYEPRYQSRVPLPFAGRTWTVEYVSQPAFEQGSGRSLLKALLLAGLLFSGWLAWFAFRITREREAADRANRAKSLFLANMSHELRTPLNAISGYVDLMELGIPDPPTSAQQGYLERIRRAQEHLLGLINDVLNFAKLDAGRVEYEAGPVSVAPLVRESMDMVLPVAAAADIACELREGPDLTAVGDAERIRQVLLNLLGNAVKFTEPGGRIEVCWEERQGFVEISVTDTGIGIEPADQARIFEPFVQVDADLTRVRQGTGLGLSISRALARHMNGDIHVRSAKGTGSTFTLCIPAAGAPARETAAAGG